MNKALHWTGSALALTGIVFVALRLRDYGGQIDFSRFNATAWVIVASFAFIYGLSNLMLALAWRNLLSHFGANMAKRWVFKIYGISQLARYVPGNIFHLAGRQAMGMADGVAGWPLAKASAWELGLISVTGGIFGGLALPLIAPTIPLIVGLGIFAVMIAGVAMLLWRYLGWQMVGALGWYAGFLAISGLLFVGLINVVATHTEPSRLPWLSLCGAYVIAWLAGLVTPGAPAGLGVRELVLLFLLNGFVAEADLVLAVVLGRIVTVGGDLATFCAAALLKTETENRGD